MSDIRQEDLRNLIKKEEDINYDRGMLKLARLLLTLLYFRENQEKD